MVNSKVINKKGDHSALQFSICTIITDDDQYQQMRNSFEKNGFTDNCEYVIVDNRQQNNKDAYQAINWFMQTAKGEYILVVHQDIICQDKKNELLNILAQLENKDPRWAVCGNAGCFGYKQCYFHLINAGKKKLSKDLPRQVNSLDENFLLIKSSRKPAVSTLLSGFHLYGTDLCLNALQEGHTAYVIPFLVEHLSLGNLSDLEKYISPFIEVHSRSETGQFIQTTCTKFYLGRTPAQSQKLNSPFNFELIKFWQRIKAIVR